MHRPRRCIVLLYVILIVTFRMISCASDVAIGLPLRGEWEVQTSVPPVSPHYRFIFFDDKTLAIFDDADRMFEKNVMSDVTDRSFVATIVYAAEDHPVPGIAGTTTYATYRFIGEDILILRFYDDDTKSTLYVKFQLGRVADSAIRDRTPPEQRYSLSSDEHRTFSREDCLSLKEADFDLQLPDWQYSRVGGELKVIRNHQLSDSQFGIISIPGGGATTRSGLPYATFRIDCKGRLADTTVSFMAHVPQSSEWRYPYVVLAVDADNDGQADGWVVGSRRMGFGSIRHGDTIWHEYRLDADTPIHAADYRVNLGSRFLPQNKGLFSDLVETPMRDERKWGDLQVVFAGVSAGAWGGSSFKAYVDDIKVCSARPPKPKTLAVQLQDLWRDLLYDFDGEGTVAITGFSTREGESTGLAILLDEMAIQAFDDRKTLQIIDRERVVKFLNDRFLTPFDLLDTGKAIEIGELLQADYIFTGTIIEMAASAVVFGRILNVQTGQIMSTAQLSIPLDDELQYLLGGS